MSSNYTLWRPPPKSLRQAPSASSRVSDEEIHRAALMLDEKLVVSDSKSAIKSSSKPASQDVSRPKRPRKKQDSMLMNTLDENLLVVHIFTFLDPDGTLPRCAAVCKDWQVLVDDPYLWKEACAMVWGSKNLEQELKQKRYKNSYKLMYLYRDRMRFDGHYTLTCKYLQHVERTIDQPAHTVTVSYHRYMYFRPDGTVYYALLTIPPSKGKLLEEDNEKLKKGRWRWRPKEEGYVDVVVDVGHMTAFFNLQLHENRKGAHNRIIMKEFKGHDVTQGVIRFPVPAYETQFEFSRIRDV